MQQIKEQRKSPPDQTNEEEIGSLPKKEFRVMIVKMIQNIGNRMEKIQETINKDLEELKSKQTMMNNTKNEIKNTLEEINGRITKAEQISDLEDKIVEITAAEQNKEKRISFRFNGEIKTFTGKQKLREFSTTKPALQQMQKELL